MTEQQQQHIQQPMITHILTEGLSNMIDVWLFPSHANALDFMRNRALNCWPNWDENHTPGEYQSMSIQELSQCYRSIYFEEEAWGISIEEIQPCTLPQAQTYLQEKYKNAIENEDILLYINEVPITPEGHLPAIVQGTVEGDNLTVTSVLASYQEEE